MKISFKKIAVSNILSLSKNATDFSLAIKEWQFSGVMVDHLEATEICELCEKKGLRYHFEIKNMINGNKLNVGSHCIEKFDIAVIDELGVQVEKSKSRYLMKLLKDKVITEKLTWLVDNGSSGEIRDYTFRELDEHVLGEYNKYKSFRPKELNYLFKRLDSNEIQYTPSFFKVDLAQAYFHELIQLSDNQFNRIKGALTPTQLRKYKEYMEE